MGTSERLGTSSRCDECSSRLDTLITRSSGSAVRGGFTLFGDNVTEDDTALRGGKDVRTDCGDVLGMECTRAECGALFPATCPSVVTGSAASRSPCPPCLQTRSARASPSASGAKTVGTTSLLAQVGSDTRQSSSPSSSATRIAEAQPAPACKTCFRQLIPEELCTMTTRPRTSSWVNGRVPHGFASTYVRGPSRDRASSVHTASRPLRRRTGSHNPPATMRITVSGSGWLAW
mmetsp:Transcript_4603/g.13998  ORF Transcript_4603/g.13998 Transcript_4603/m.13998 type:complete len:233 (-) Transcript_4603:61-759(-)